MRRQMDVLFLLRPRAIRLVDPFGKTLADISFFFTSESFALDQLAFQSPPKINLQSTLGLLHAFCFSLSLFPFRYVFYACSTTTARTIARIKTMNKSSHREAIFFLFSLPSFFFRCLD
ncbi:hypothetical protein PGTUg99_031234 [Puccinia graminis f. sp. tritici]|uniref:Uncharacterized protein n=1 Tax=Puccinia graminis f. sp. tritici TaxID=56615 RepID=A0A5B0RWS5_PUCGR|nr:hypothetical protein PGTUg99_031234 [Puccinia graminis f. sp. tritici]